MRGPGDLFGIRQSGLMDFKVGDIYQDAGLLKEAESCVGRLLEKDPKLELPEHRILHNYVKQALVETDFRTI